MASKWEFTRQTKAPVSKVIDYFSHPENLPQAHPDFIKSVTVKGRDGDQVNFEQQMELMKRKIVSQNKMMVNRTENWIEINTLEGDGKGSKITMSFAPNQAGTEITYHAEMELGALGIFAKGPAKSAMEKVATEDAGYLDAS
jgi:Polyketide cyclase / dehydrase and lipid transport